MLLSIDLPKKASDVLVPPGRFKCLFGGRDSAKSWSAARYLVARALARKERILCVREIQNSIADSVHKLISDQITALGVSDSFSVQQQYIRCSENGSEFAFRGLSKETAISLKSFEGTTIAWVEEAQNVSKRSWGIFEPTIRAPESEIIVTFNPDLETDATYQMFVANPSAEVRSAHMNWQDNPWRSVVLDKAREKMLAESPEEYAHIYLGECRPAVEGAIYYTEVSALRNSGRLCNVPYDPLLKVHRVWDLGWNDYMSVGFVQRQASEIRLIRYVEDNHRTYADFMTEFSGYGYNYGTDWLPHDGRAKSAESGRSPQMILEQLGCKVEIVEDIGLENGIKATRLLFPRLYVDKTNAGELVNRLGRYRRRINKETGTATTPMHDDESHGADMTRYLACIADQLANVSDNRIKDPYAAFRR